MPGAQSSLFPQKIEPTKKAIVDVEVENSQQVVDDENYCPELDLIDILEPVPRKPKRKTANDRIELSINKLLTQKQEEKRGKAEKN